MLALAAALPRMPRLRCIYLSTYPRRSGNHPRNGRLDVLEPRTDSGDFANAEVRRAHFVHWRKGLLDFFQVLSRANVSKLQSLYSYGNIFPCGLFIPTMEGGTFGNEIFRQLTVLHLTITTDHSNDTLHYKATPNPLSLIRFSSLLGQAKQLKNVHLKFRPIFMLRRDFVGVDFGRMMGKLCPCKTMITILTSLQIQMASHALILASLSYRG